MSIDAILKATFEKFEERIFDTIKADILEPLNVLLNEIKRKIETMESKLDELEGTIFHLENKLKN